MDTRIFLLSFRMALFVFTVALPCLLAAEDSIPTYVLEEYTEEVIRFREEMGLYADTTGKLTLRDVLGDAAPRFRGLGEVPDNMDYALWMRLRIHNATDRSFRKLLMPTPNFYLGTAYVLQGDSVVYRRRIGRGVPARERDYYSGDTHFNLNIPSGETRTVLVRTDFGDEVFFCCRTLAELATPKRQWVRKVERTALYYFYLGLMVSLAVVSGFAFLLFRSSVFLYFSGLMLMFGAYFLTNSNQLAPLFRNGIRLDYMEIGNLSILGIFGTLALFIAAYLKLSERMPRILPYFRFFTLLALLLPLTFFWWQYRPGWTRILLAENILYFLWALFSFFLIGKLALRGYREARALALAIVLLFLGSLVTILEIIGVLPASPVFAYAFQLSTLPFAGIVFQELFTRYTDLRKEKEQLAETDGLKTRFFANITHEFRTPLTLMLGPLRQVIDRTEEPGDLALLRVAEINAERQLALVDQLLDLAQLDASAMMLRATQTDLTAYLRQVLSAYESLADQRRISLELSLPETVVPLYFEEEKMNRILYNLLTNAFKFTPAGGRIRVAMTQDAKFAEVQVADTGRGIAPELLPHIFDRFFLAGNGRADTKGSGIGLALVREMVRLHHGKVSVTSRVGEGSTFTLRFPLGDRHLTPEEIADQPAAPTPDPDFSAFAPQVESTDVDATPVPAASGAQPTLLLVEDNVEMRAFLLQMLAPHYRVTTAGDGAEGVSLALADPPDLIVSDLMMPEKDGYQLCRELKTDLRTSHVPVILLTARASRDALLEGLGEGADDYLTKPFDARELLARAANLIRSRRVLRERFAAAITVPASELAVNPLDQDFLTRALAHVEKHLTDAQLSVDQLADALGTSRTQLNRKLRALVNQSSNQFIQSVRLQRAVQLLRQDGATVKEVAYSCGFSSPGYFSKVFRKEFGVAPGEYAEEVINE